MKKSILCALLFLSAPLFAVPLTDQVERAVAAAIAVRNQRVTVSAKLVKPVYSSDVMFRRPRGRDVVIATRQKENTCTGLWDTTARRIYLPAACVQEEKYRLETLRVTFTGGRSANILGSSVKVVGDVALVTL